VRSHHPPVTAYCIWNQDKGVRLQGYNAQKASISKTLTITVKVCTLLIDLSHPLTARQQVGHATLHLDAFNEDYLITLPSLHIEGVYSGAPFVELNSSSYIQSSSGYTAKIDYSGRGWLSGKKNSFTASLYPEGKPKEAVYTVDGQWSAGFSIKDAKTKKEIDAFDPAKNPTSKLLVAAIEEQDEMESRRAWQKVAIAIGKGDMDATSAEKSLIENEQREMRKKEKEDGREWERRFFSRTEKDLVFEALGKKIGESLDAEKTGGAWAWDADKAKDAKPPFKK
jgi:hypothetical protein